MATFTKRESKGKTVWGAQIRRKGQPSISATFARLTDARRWAARQEAAISEARAVVLRNYSVPPLYHPAQKPVVRDSRHLPARPACRFALHHVMVE